MFFRPEWTSGRYDKSSHSAILYNLLTGMSYFFEDISADIIGYILGTERLCKVNVRTVAVRYTISETELLSFFKQLSELGLLSDGKISADDYLCSLRDDTSKGHNRYDNEPKTVVGEEDIADAEKDYLERSHSKIFSLLIELTYKCSEKCIHCYNPGATRNDSETSHRSEFKELGLDDYKRIIDEFYNQGLIRVTLSGGDPFSKSVVWDILEYLYRKNIAFDIYTNGQGIYGCEERLAKYFPCSVGISLYSDIPDVHDSITRVRGSFFKTMHVIQRLSNLSIPISLKCCIMHQNCKSYRGVMRIADKYAATAQFECNIFDSVDGDKCVSKYLRLSPEEMKIVLRDKDLLLYVGPEKDNFGMKSMPPDKNACAAGYCSFCLTPSGKLTLCPSFPSAISDLTKQSVTEALKNPDLVWWRELKWSDYTDCGREEYCSFCTPCPGVNFSDLGSPTKPSENNCYIAKMRMDVAVSLKNGRDPLNGMSIDDALAQLPDIATCTISRIQTKSFYNNKLSGKEDTRF